MIQARPRLIGGVVAFVFCLFAWPSGSVVAQEGAVEPAVIRGGSDEQSRANLAATIDSILAERELQQTTVGIHVEDVSDGTVLYSLNADQPMNPASNTKLLTAAAALDLLGPEYTLSTHLLTDKRERGSVENLYLRAGGEAFLLFRDILSWASELRMQGVERVEGDLIIDDGVFHGAYLPPGFDLRPSDAAWRPMVGALSVNFNAVTATVSGGDRIGASPRVRLDPPNDHVTVINQARTVRGRVSRIWVVAEEEDGGQGTKIYVRGTIGIDAEGVSFRKRIDNPPAFAGSVVARAMRMMGIEFNGEVRVGATPPDAILIYRHNSQPLINAISAMNKWSNNFIAEQLLRLMGVVDDEPSTWDRARERASKALSTYGLELGSFTLYNGSGLYDGNLVSPRQFVSLLRRMRTHRYGPEFVSSLAIAGVDGTLRHRLGGEWTTGNLRGKTGTLNDVAALTGYVHTRSGRLVAFSIIFNDPPRRAWNYRHQQDAIARAIADFDG